MLWIKEKLPSVLPRRMLRGRWAEGSEEGDPGTKAGFHEPITNKATV